jgi:hypothetical protein
MILQKFYFEVKILTMVRFGLDKNLIRGVLWKSITKKKGRLDETAIVDC